MLTNVQSNFLSGLPVLVCLLRTAYVVYMALQFFAPAFKLRLL
jgi:uncharacterized membrane protein